MTLSAAAEAAERVRNACAGGGRPLDPDIGLISQTARGFDELRRKIESAHDTVITGDTLDELQRAFDRLEAARYQASRVRDLARLQGPPALETLLADVREAATAEVPSPALDTLAQLIALSGDPETILEACEVHERMREQAPSHWRPLTVAAISSLLSIPAPAVPATGRGDDLSDLDAFLEQSFGTRKHAPGRAKAKATETRAAPGTIAATGAVEAIGDLNTAGIAGAAGPAGEDIGVVEAEVAALGMGRFGLAAWLRVVEGRPEAEVGARRCAAIAEEMSEFSGRLSAAFAASAAGVSMRALADDTPGQLLAWAAAMRTGLIHPTIEATRLLDELAPVMSGHPALMAFGDAFAQVARTGVYLVPGLSSRMRDAAKADDSQRRAVAAAARLLSDGPRRTIKFALATEVWRLLLLEDSPVGNLLSITARDEVGRVREASQRLDDLRAAGVIDKLINGMARGLTTNRGSNRIIAGPRGKLLEMIHEGLDHVAAWVTAVRKVEALRTDDSGSAWLVGPLAELREVVGRHRDDADAELERLGSHDDPLVAAAGAGAAVLIRGALALLDGSPLGESEPTSAHVLNSDLLLVRGLTLDPDSLLPASSPDRDALIRLALNGDRSERHRLRTRPVRDQARKFELAGRFDARSYQAPYRDGRDRSPLTESQVAWLLRPHNVFHMITGSAALHVERVPMAVEDAAKRHGLAHAWRVGVDGLTFDEAVQRAEPDTGRHIVIVDLSATPHAQVTSTIRAAGRAVSTASGGTLAIAMVAPPEHALHWLAIARGAGERANLVELGRFDRSAVRQWMHEEELGFQDKAGQDALLRVTGGWPVLISQVTRELSGDGADREQALQSCVTYLREAGATFVRSTGVLSSTALAAAWHQLTELGGCEESPEELAELLSMAGADADGHPLSESCLQEEGFTSTADLVEVLRVLGGLVPRANGKLEREPVLAEATRLMEQAR